MEYPYSTTQGNTYEYGEIFTWLREHNTDPKSMVTLQSKILIPNNSLRSQIIDWFEAHKQYPKPVATLKPPSSTSAAEEPEELTELNKILCYKGSKTLAKKKKATGRSLPSPKYFPEYGKTFFFSEGSERAGLEGLKVSCEGGESITPPESAMFLTSQGVIFFDPTEIRDTKVIPGIDDSKQQCKYGKICNNEKCKNSHPFVCSLGVTCSSLIEGGPFCKFYHPDADSIVPLGETYPLNQVCKYGCDCSGKKCGFAHPLGRYSHKRENAAVLITHSHNLQKLETPIPLKLDIPEAAKYFQFQGDFVFFFVPYPGSWALKHYQKVIVHRFDMKAQLHQFIGEYSLENHYCNCVAGAGKYFIISFWPYEEEAVRTIWDSLKIARSMEKVFRKKEKSWKVELEKKDQEIEKLNQEIIVLRNKVSAVELQLLKKEKILRENRKREQMRKIQAQQHREAREREAILKRERFLQEQKLREEKFRRDRERNERLRMRDPIHIYQLSSGSGTQKSDWTLVVDYHKGAHDIKLEFDRKSECHSLEIIENENVFCFDMLFPDLQSLSDLPLVPERLCAEF